jgi:phosphoglycerate kinase
MSGIKYFPQDLNIENKNIILRLDFNVPLKNKQIQDYTRISTVLPLLKDLVKRKSKIIILSHLGRPEGLKINDLSLLPVFKYLKKQLDTNIYFYTGEINELAKNKVSFLKSGEIILFENIRFFEGENKNDENFSEKLGGLADIFINDAFSCSHRAQASIHKITKFVKNLYGGPLLKKEINAIDLVIKNKKKPVTCIIGGSKISTKINIISNLMKNVDSIILVGAMANNFLAYKGFKVGKSLVESDSKKIIDKIYDDAKENNCKIIIPSDYSVSTSFDGSAKTRLQNKITDDEIILDIGPQTIEKIEDIIDKSNTVLWNGPACYFENKNFAKGTVSIANKISQNTINRSLISILGGGDTVSAVNKIENELFFTHLSTAGGAFLEYLEGKDLPGLSVLK